MVFWPLFQWLHPADASLLYSGVWFLSPHKYWNRGFCHFIVFWCDLLQLRQASRYNLLFHACFFSVICKLFSIDLILSSSADCRTHGVKRKQGFLLLPYNLSPSIYFLSRQALPFNSYLWYERTTKVYFTNSVQLNLNLVILALTRRALFSGRKDDNISRTKEKETG